MRLHADPVPYSKCPGFGPEHILARIAACDLEGFPLLKKNSAELSTKLSQFPEKDPVFIISGQQPCLLTGPLFTILKAVTTISLARTLSETQNRPVRPLFWNASEDHDIIEVNRTFLKDHKLVCPYNGSLKRGQVPQVKDISLAEEKTRIIEAVKTSISDDKFKSYALQLLENCSFISYATLFSDLLTSFFEPWELEVLEPFSLREKTGPVLANLLEKWPETVAAFQRGTKKLLDAGFSPPLSSLIFFEIVKGRRTPVEIKDNRVTLSSGIYSLDQAAEKIRNNPGNFSPGAALRPVLQDSALPVVATVAGPTEILYLWQIQEIYTVPGIKPSLLFPRISATFTDDKLKEKISDSKTSLPELFALLDNTRLELENISSPVIDSIDSSFLQLQKDFKKAETAFNSRLLSRNIRSIEKIVKKTLNALRKETIAHRGEFDKISEMVLPRGKLQERTVNIFDFLGSYGPGWIKALCEDLDPWDLNHKIVTF